MTADANRERVRRDTCNAASPSSEHDELRKLAEGMRNRFSFGPDDFQYLNRLADGVLSLLAEIEALQLREAGEDA